MPRNTRQKNRKKQATLAESADRHKLYEYSVQYAEAEIEFVDELPKTPSGKIKRTELRQRG